MEKSRNVRKDALQKIRDHISVANICLLTNNILDWPLQSESLKNQWLAEDGCIWFLGFKPDSNAHRFLHDRMEVFYSNRVDSKFLSLIGTAVEVRFSDVNEIDGFPFRKNSDSNVSTPYTLVKFFPEEAFQWDDVVNEMVELPLFEELSNVRAR